MYSKNEVDEMFEQVKLLITNNMDNEITYYLNMNGK